MLTDKVIDAIYKKYKKRPSSPDQLDIPLLFSEELEQHDIYIDDRNIVINSVDASSPFHKIALERVHEILEFENVVAIVLHSSIVFVSKRDDKVHVHVKMMKPTLLDRIRMKLSGEDE